MEIWYSTYQISLVRTEFAWTHVVLERNALIGFNSISMVRCVRS